MGRKKIHNTEEEKGKAYLERYARTAKRNLELGAAARDLLSIPDVVKPGRKRYAKKRLRYFCEQYLPNKFHLAWSPSHLAVIEKLEQAVLDGGLFAVAMPRGSGKTALTVASCLWALLYGHHSFVVLIGSDEDAAGELLTDIKTNLETNDLLDQDFPEVTFPIRSLGGSAHRAKGQHLKGERTHIMWRSKEVVLPRIKGSPASEGKVEVAGITGRIRGKIHTRTDGSQVRPTLVVLDDPQTDEAARSESQCETRRRLINSAVLKLAGPGEKISAVMPCTVIREGDLADQMLDPKESPEWRPERTKMLVRFPANMDLWGEYDEIRRASMERDGTIGAATEFYRDNRTAMDEGAEVSWESRYNPDEISALQHAMNWFYLDERSFRSEFQNDPMGEIEEGVSLSVELVKGKANGYDKGLVPTECDHLTAFIDVQGQLLYWVVCGWVQERFDGYIVDYGAWPDQKDSYFTLENARYTLERQYPGKGEEGRIYAGLQDLCDSILGREWTRDDGLGIRIGRCLIDAGWGAHTENIHRFCRQSSHAAIVAPMQGVGVRATSKPFNDYKAKPGERKGHHWRLTAREGRLVRQYLFDTNYWKSFTANRFRVSMGDKGCLSLFGRDRDHTLFAHHCVAEYAVRAESQGRVVDEWKHKPDRPDNHWWDCLVGNHVAASTLGVNLMGESQPRSRKRKERVSFSELQRRKREGR